jgi:hypothetical protein
MIKTDFIENPG